MDEPRQAAAWRTLLAAARQVHSAAVALNDAETVAEKAGLDALVAAAEAFARCLEEYRAVRTGSGTGSGP